MINVQEVLRDAPSFDKFCSVSELHELVEALPADAGFRVSVAGRSANGLPIHHVRFGEGSVKALFVAFGHCMEPAGGLSAASLLTLLANGQRELLEADVEWHVVPCIDPDGALLNEGWTQHPFTLGNYMRNYYVQSWLDQVDCSFPIQYKKLSFDRPTVEASVLLEVMREVRPDFYQTLHHYFLGGAFIYITHDIGNRYYQEIHELLAANQIPVNPNPPNRAYCARYGEAVYQFFSVKILYDFLEKTSASPEQLIPIAAGSWDYLAEINDDAVTFVCEPILAKHPSAGSEQETKDHLRQLKLRADTDDKFVASRIHEEWDAVKDDVDRSNPLYRAVVSELIDSRSELSDRTPFALSSTSAILADPSYSGLATEGRRFEVFMERFRFLFHSYQFVRLLKESPQTVAITEATARLEAVFDEALSDIGRSVDFDAFEPVDCDTLARVQLGTGLIALNAMLDKPAASP